MGPESWTPDKDAKFKKCSEFSIGPCDTEKTDGCCAVIPCNYCLTWAVYGETDENATAEFLVDGWYGTIAGVTFRGYWEKNYTTEECEFVVTLDDEEVYRNDCYGGQSCRDSTDSIEVTIGYDDGTLTWEKIEPRPLEYVVDEDTGCRRHFCGTCECSCDCLSVTVVDSYAATVTTGDICDTAYACDGPVWEGVVGGYDLSLALGIDVYGNCILTPTVDGITHDAVEVTGCADMTATFDISDDVTVFVQCKRCGSEVVDEDCDLTDRPLYVTGDYTVTVNNLGGTGVYGPFIYWEYEFVGAPCEFNLYVKCENNPDPPDLASPSDSMGRWVAIVGCHHSTGTETINILSVNPFLCVMTCDAAPGNPFGCDLPKEIVISE